MFILRLTGLYDPALAEDASQSQGKRHVYCQGQSVHSLGMLGSYDL